MLSLSQFACAHQISSKSDNFHWHGALTISKWWQSAILDFRKLQFMSWLFSACHSASPCKHWLKSVDRLLSYVQKRFSRWRPSIILNLKKLIFGHVTVIGFNICCSVPNFMKIGRFLPRDALEARPLPLCGVCLSICPSVTFVDSVETNRP